MLRTRERYDRFGWIVLAYASEVAAFAEWPTLLSSMRVA
jgi:hypothetical protein